MGNRVFFEPKSWWKMIFTNSWKVLVLNFSMIRNTVCFSTKKLMERWCLLGLFKLSIIFRDLANMVLRSVRPNFLLVARYFLLIARYFFPVARYFLFVARYFLLVAHYFLLVACYIQLVARYFLVVACCPLLSAHCSLSVTYCSLLITFCSLLTTFWSTVCFESIIPIEKEHDRKCLN